MSPEEKKSSQALGARIRGIGKRSANLAKDIHECGVQALVHALTYNDARPVGNLLNALHTANRPKAFKSWVEMFSPIRWNGDGKVGMLKETAKTYVPFNVDGADAMPYYVAEETPQPKALTFEELIEMVGRIGKTVDKAEEGKGSKFIPEGQDIGKMRALVARLTAAIGEPPVNVVRGDTVVETLAGPVTMDAGSAALATKEPAVRRGLAAPKAA